VVVAVLGLAGLGWGVREWQGGGEATVSASAAVQPAAPAAPAAPPKPPLEAPAAPPAQVHVESTTRGVELVVDTSPAREEREIVHTVVAGDTLWAIAKHYIHDPWAYRDLAARSGIHNPDLIHPGDQVHIVFRGEGPTQP
jgi:nucleoid-associated protein YgaU